MLGSARGCPLPSCPSSLGHLRTVAEAGRGPGPDPKTFPSTAKPTTKAGVKGPIQEACPGLCALAGPSARGLSPSQSSGFVTPGPG